MNIEHALFLELLDQGIDVTAVGLPYARRAYPDLDAMAAADAYSRGFLDGCTMTPYQPRRHTRCGP